jgi:filamentous hemagglutinin
MRVFSKEGRKDIAEDLERTKRLGTAIAEVATSDAFKIKDTFDHIDDVQKDLDVQKAMALKDNGKLLDILDDKNRDKYSIEDRDKAIDDYAQIYADTYDISIEDAKSVATSKYGGMIYTNQEGTSSNIYINDNHNNGALDTARTMGHEVAHARMNQGQTRQRETQNLQEEYADIMGSYSSSGMEFSGTTYANVNLNNNLPTTPRQQRSNADITRLTDNTNEFIKGVARDNSGDGEIEYETLVKQIDDNSYEVTGGTPNDDKGIYNQKTGEKIGESYTKYSFFNEEGKPQKGAIIDTKDNSGKEFLANTEWVPTGLYHYFAKSGKAYDFKTNDMPDGLTPNEQYNYHLRGMPVNGTKMDNNFNVNTYGSARDIGNYQAGWKFYDYKPDIKEMRESFDGYNSSTRDSEAKEKPNSTIPQTNGFNDNKKQNQKKVRFEYTQETGQTLPSLD